MPSSADRACLNPSRSQDERSSLHSLEKAGRKARVSDCRVNRRSTGSPSGLPKSIGTVSRVRAATDDVTLSSKVWGTATP